MLFALQRTWQSMCLSILNRMKSVPYTTQSGAVMNAAEDFQAPVDPKAFPDYRSFVSICTLHAVRFAGFYHALLDIVLF